MSSVCKVVKMEYDSTASGIPSFPPIEYAEYCLIMSGDNPTPSRSPGRALIVGRPPFRGGPAAALHRRGYLCTEVDEPYEAMVHLCKRPLFYSAIILSLNSLYREELAIIASIRRRFSHVDIWLSDTDGRQAALAEAMRLGADGLFADDGLHRVAGDSSVPDVRDGTDIPTSEVADADPPREQPGLGLEKSTDPLLTAEELRALLQETPTPHPG
jgi:hypothetical protein